jgi:hypothetical protein
MAAQRLGLQPQDRRRPDFIRFLFVDGPLSTGRYRAIALCYDFTWFLFVDAPVSSTLFHVALCWFVVCLCWVVAGIDDGGGGGCLCRCWWWLWWW